MASSFTLLHPKLRKVIDSKKFVTQTLPQAKGIPVILNGENVLIIARTGSGKTESAMFPIFSKILDMKDKVTGIKLLYIAPLRALNRDLIDRIGWWADEIGLTAQVRHGDTTQYQRRKQALSPPDILIITPETLQAMLTGKLMRDNLKTVRYVVIDEIHELASDKRGMQLSVGLERLLRISGEFQRIGLSATVGSPEEIARFLTGMRPCRIIDATEKKMFDIKVEYIKVKPEDEEFAQSLSTSAENAARVSRINELVNENESVLTFVNTREMAEALSSRFNVFSDEVDVHHSSLSKKVRIETEKKFKSQHIKCIICTSSMELGIDVGSVSLVIQYMSPRQVSRLIQRVGRSGHKYNENPKGIIISVDADDILEAAVIARRAKENKLEEIKVYNKPLDVLAHQLVGLSMEIGDVNKDEAFELVTRAAPYISLKREEFEDVLSLLSSLRLVWLEDESYHKSKFALKYYFENLSVIPDVKKFRVVEIASNRSIGVLDEEFVIERANIGMTFIMKGRAWNVIDVGEDLIIVEETSGMAAAPAWEGELIPIPFEIAQEVFHLRERIADYAHEISFSEEICRKYPMNEEAYHIVEQYVLSQKPKGIPTANGIYLEFLQSLAIFHTGFGSVINETIGRVLAALYSTKFGTSVAMKSGAYHIGFKFPFNVTLEDVTCILDSLRPENIRPILELSLKRSNMFFWKFSHVASRFGVLSKDVEKFKIKSIMNSYEDTPVYRETYNELFSKKLDVSMAEAIVRDYKDGKILLSVKERKHASPFAQSLLAKFGYGELIGPRRPEREILKLLKKRLEDRRIRLFCIYCGRWHASVKIGHMNESPKCPLCGARFLAIIDKKDEKTRKAVIKRMKKQDISEEEEELVIRAKRTADLILVYGKRAAMALSARGIGAQTAARVLAKMHPTEESFLKDVLETEKTYARTRRFWD
ncbi:MAG: DEAD/DEAH box helicase [Candidatus Methanofastidiosia archaeon]